MLFYHACHFFYENKKEVLYGSTECRMEVMSNT